MGAREVLELAVDARELDFNRFSALRRALPGATRSVAERVRGAPARVGEPCGSDRKQSLRPAGVVQSAERCMTALTTLRHGSCGFSKSASGAKSGRRGAGVSKEGRPCSDCGAIYHPAAMHWDHRPGTAKVTEVSHLVRRASRGAALKEIRKCDLVCANCHAVRTYERQRGVAQPGRAPALGAGGRRFRSGRPD